MAWYHLTKFEKQMLIDAGQCVRCYRRRDWVGAVSEKYPATLQYCPACNKILKEAAERNRDDKQLMLAAGSCERCGKPRGVRGDAKHCMRHKTQAANEKKQRARNKRYRLKNKPNTEEK